MHEPLSVLTCNLKGGVGKTTLATNLAACFAARDWKAILLDCDAQQSAAQWVHRRETGEPSVAAIDAHSLGGLVAPTLRLRIPGDADCLIYDAPAGIRGTDMGDLLRRVQVVLVPILPSVMDLEASQRFVSDLRRSREARAGRLRIGLIANRIRDSQLSTRRLRDSVAEWNVPLLAELRDTQLYPYACGVGRAIHELRTPRADPDRETWNRLYDEIFRLASTTPATDFSDIPASVTYLRPPPG